MLYLRNAACPDSGLRVGGFNICVHDSGHKGAVELQLTLTTACEPGNKGIPTEPGCCSHPTAAARLHHCSQYSLTPHKHTVHLYLTTLHHF